MPELILALTETDVVLASIKQLKLRCDTLEEQLYFALYAMKSAKASVTRGRQYPEMFDNGTVAELLQAAIDSIDEPLPVADFQEAA